MLTLITHNRRRVLGAAAAAIAAGGLALAGVAELRSRTPLSGEPLMSDPSTAATPSGLSGLVRSFVHRLAGDSGELLEEGPLPAFMGATG